MGNGYIEIYYYYWFCLNFSIKKHYEPLAEIKYTISMNLRDSSTLLHIFQIGVI